MFGFSLVKYAKNFLGSCEQALFSPRFASFLMFVLCATCVFAQSTTTGVTAFETVASDIQQYIPAIQKVIYAVAGIVAIGGAISVYIKMNNEEQDVKKSIMMIVGACIFLIAAAQSLPLFFGISQTSGN